MTESTRTTKAPAEYVYGTLYSYSTSAVAAIHQSLQQLAGDKAPSTSLRYDAEDHIFTLRCPQTTGQVLDGAMLRVLSLQTSEQSSGIDNNAVAQEQSTKRLKFSQVGLSLSEDEVEYASTDETAVDLVVERAKHYDNIGTIHIVLAKAKTPHYAQLIKVPDLRCPLSKTIRRQFSTPTVDADTLYRVRPVCHNLESDQWQESEPRNNTPCTAAPNTEQLFTRAMQGTIWRTLALHRGIDTTSIGESVGQWLDHLESTQGAEEDQEFHVVPAVEQMLDATIPRTSTIGNVLVTAQESIQHGIPIASTAEVVSAESNEEDAEDDFDMLSFLEAKGELANVKVSVQQHQVPTAVQTGVATASKAADAAQKNKFVDTDCFGLKGRADNHAAWLLDPNEHQSPRDWETAQACQEEVTDDDQTWVNNRVLNAPRETGEVLVNIGSAEDFPALGKAALPPVRGQKLVSRTMSTALELAPYIVTSFAQSQEVDLIDLSDPGITERLHTAPPMDRLHRTMGQHKSKKTKRKKISKDNNSVNISTTATAGLVTPRTPEEIQQVLAEPSQHQRTRNINRTAQAAAEAVLSEFLMTIGAAGQLRINFGTSLLEDHHVPTLHKPTETANLTELLNQSCIKAQFVVQRLRRQDAGRSHCISYHEPEEQFGHGMDPEILAHLAVRLKTGAVTHVEFAPHDLDGAILLRNTEHQLILHCVENVLDAQIVVTEPDKGPAADSVQQFVRTFKFEPNAEGCRCYGQNDTMGDVSEVLSMHLVLRFKRNISWPSEAATAQFNATWHSDLIHDLYISHSKGTGAVSAAFDSMDHLQAQERLWWQAGLLVKEKDIKVEALLSLIQYTASQLSDILAPIRTVATQQNVVPSAMTDHIEW